MNIILFSREPNETVLVNNNTSIFFNILSFIVIF
jgi:hypothetical protein